MTDAEQKMLAGIAGPNQTPAGKLAERLGDATKEFVGALNAKGYDVVTDGTVPDQLRRHVVARAVWDWLAQDFPSLKTFQTDARKIAAQTAEDTLEKILAGTYGPVESPNGTDKSTGNWNSEPKILGRMHPLPGPAIQFPGTAKQYANPNAEEDTVDSNSPGTPDVPKNLLAAISDAQVVLTWGTSRNALSYTIYRGTSPTVLVVLAAAVTDTKYADAGLVNGTTYYYYVKAINGILVSDPSDQVSAIPAA